MTNIKIGLRLRELRNFRHPCLKDCVALLRNMGRDGSDHVLRRSGSGDTMAVPQLSTRRVVCSYMRGAPNCTEYQT